MDALSQNDWGGGGGGDCRYSDVVWRFLKLTCNYIFLQHDLISIHVFDSLFSSYCMFMFVFSERIWLNLSIIRVSCGGKFFAECFCCILF